MNVAITYLRLTLQIYHRTIFKIYLSALESNNAVFNSPSFSHPLITLNDEIEATVYNSRNAGAPL